LPKNSDYILSHNVVPSAQVVLTSLFEMVRGAHHRNNH